MRILALMGVLLCVEWLGASGDLHAEPIGEGKRVCVLNTLEKQILHLHFGNLRFSRKETRVDPKTFVLPDFVDQQLQEKLHALGYEVTSVAIAPENRIDVQNYLSFLWNDYRLSKKGRRDLASTMSREGCNFIVVIHDFPKADHVGFSQYAISGYGLYTSGSVAKIFGHIIGYVAKGNDAELMGTSAPPYTVDTKVKELSGNSLSEIEPTLSLFGEQLVSGILMNLDGTFQ